MTSTLKRVASDIAELDSKTAQKTARKEVADAGEFVSVLNEEQQEHLDEEIGGIVDAVRENYETCDMFKDCRYTCHAEGLFKEYKECIKSDVKYAIEVAVEEKTAQCRDNVNRGMVCDAVSNAFIDLVDLDLFKNVNKTFLTAEVLRVIGDDLTIGLVEEMVTALSDFEEDDSEGEEDEDEDEDDEDEDEEDDEDDDDKE
jgi:uncharacterized protein YaaR (DUF327 family)